MDCGQIVRKFAQRNRTATAVTFEGETLSAQQLLERSFRLANGLTALGIRPGDTVATLGLNALRSVEEITGLAIGGFVRVPLHQGNTSEGHRYMLEHSRSRVLITDAAGVAELGDAVINLEHLEAIIVDDDDSPLRYDDVLAAAAQDDPNVWVRDDDPIQLSYTGGTTGRPKGAVHTHGRWLDVCTDNIELLPPRRETPDRFVASGPLSGAAGSYLFSCLAHDIQIIVAPDRTTSTAARLVREHSATILMALPPLVQALADDADIVPSEMSSLRRILSVGAPLSSRSIRSVAEKFGSILTFGYGQSECAPISALTPDLIARGLDGEPHLLRSVGRAMLRSNVRITGADGSPLALGETGEIEADAAGSLHSYWGDPAATAAKITPDGYVRTGDLGRIEDDGILFLSDRSEDLIVFHGRTLMPSEIENAFADHPAIHEVVVVGVPDREAGQIPRAVVSLRPGAAVDEETIERWWGTQGHGLEVPVVLHISPVPLPRTPAGKLSRRMIREAFPASALPTTR